MRLFESFEHLFTEREILWEADKPVHVAWPSDPPADPEARRELLRVVKQKVEKARFQIATRNLPVIGIYLQGLQTVFTYDVKTMAVDDKKNVYINPTFCNFLSFDEVKGVLIHEAMHVFTGTFFRQKGRKMKLWNICTDYLMNWYITRDGFKLPDGGCIPDSNGDVHFKTPDGKTHTFNIDGKTAEWLYAQAEKIMPPPSGGGKGKPGEGEPGEGEPGEGEPGEGNPTPVDSNGKPLVPTDDDAPPSNDPKKIKVEEGSKTPNTKPQDIRDIQNDIRSAIRTAKQKDHAGGQGRGTGQGSGIEDVMIKATESKTNYKQLLKNLVQKAEQYYNWRRSSRRGYAVGSWIPKLQTSQRLARITVAIDTSASLSDQMIRSIMGECIKIVKQYPGITLDIVKWDTSVYYFDSISRNTSPAAVEKAIGSKIRRGGTIMSSVAQFYKKNLNKQQIEGKGKVEPPIAVLYFTDGGVEPTPELLDPPVKNYFLIVPGGSDTILKKDKRGATFNIEV